MDDSEFADAEWIEDVDFIQDDDGDPASGSTEIAVNSHIAALINKPALTANDLMRIPFAREIMREEWNSQLSATIETPILNFLRKSIQDCVSEGVEPFLYADVEEAANLIWQIVCYHIKPRYSIRVFQQNPELMRSMVSDIRRALAKKEVNRTAVTPGMERR